MDALLTYLSSADMLYFGYFEELPSAYWNVVKYDLLKIKQQENPKYEKM